jgi:N-acetyl-anhydromuramyl-L-alanine amidase AmpD
MTDFIQARNYTPANRSSLRLIVIHTMESPEKPGTARAVAKWFASPTAPQASAHACVDNAELVLCVKETDVAWAAPHANRDGYHIEHAGFARQTLADWSDDYSAQTLRISSAHAADIATQWGIPARRLTIAEVADGKTKGFCGHADVTAAFKTFGGHTDPGTAFPWDLYIARVAEDMDKLAPEPAKLSDTEPSPPPTEAA